MIPIRLELKNFMSYGDDVPPLDFVGMHTVCLSGENGNGKSALLDAITWALWGESRAGKNRHDDLVRIGADEMSVQFTFEMDGLCYRVMRKRSKRAGGNQWELHQQTEDGGWRSLTGNNAGETEKALQKLLRMSYDTFLNSAYLRQGQADQFVKQPPGKRKEILADILDLSRYDELEMKARERERESTAEALDVERDINGIDAELSSEEGYRADLLELQQRFAELQEKQGAVKTELDDLNKQIGQLEARKALADGLLSQIQAVTLEIKEHEAHAAQHAAEETRWRALLGESDSIEKEYADLLVTREEFARLEVELRKFNKGRSMVAEAESRYAISENSAKRDAELLAAEALAAEKKLVQAPDLRRQHEQVAARLAKFDAASASKEKLEGERRAVTDRLRKLERASVALGQQIEEWDRRLEALAAQEGTCRVCNSPLPPDRIERVRAEYQSERQKCLDERKLVWADATAGKSESASFEQQIVALDAQLSGAIEDRVLSGQLSQRLQEFDEIAAGLPALKSRAVEARRIVDEELFAVEEKRQRDNYRLHFQKLEQVPAQHATLRLRLADLEPAEGRHRDLSSAQDALNAAVALREREERLVGSRRTAKAQFEAQLGTVDGVAVSLAEKNTASLERQSVLNALRNEERTVSQEIGRNGQRIADCERMRGERIGKEQRLAGLRKESEIYGQLVKAFGKKGVQALIIENAIPELQEEANRMLERLTDGDMSIYFETLREAKTKREGPVETLDIKVSDSLGTRALEMYSGGEGFRAAFALRIALSKLLAQRAGAKLQTLIIDEGFGTQDGKGREKLVDALNAIKEDFEKIIVITHIDELKDAFATRIEITKTPLGSQITVMEGANG